MCKGAGCQSITLIGFNQSRFQACLAENADIAKLVVLSDCFVRSTLFFAAAHTTQKNPTKPVTEVQL